MSFVGYRNLDEKLRQIRQEIRVSGQDISLGIPWRWMSAPPSKGKPPYDFLAYSILPITGDREQLLPMTKDELGVYLDKSKGQTTRFATMPSVCSSSSLSGSHQAIEMPSCPSRGFRFGP